MSFPRQCLRTCAAVLAVFLATSARGLDWLPVSDEERAATASTIDPAAGAEILHRIVQYDNGTPGVVRKEEYVRMKVYAEKGVDRVSQMEIHCHENERISSLEARVIKPDGSIINVDPTAFYDREVIKFKESDASVRAFSFPQLARGDIAEYKWKKIGSFNIGRAVLYFQKDMPTRYVLFRNKPMLDYDNRRTFASTYRCEQMQRTMSRDSYNCMEMRDIPAHVEEPHMPPDEDNQSWMMFYQTDSPGNPDEYWKEVGTWLARYLESEIKRAGRVVREKVRLLTGNLTDAEEKLARLNDYCRESILNVSLFSPEGDVDRDEVRQSRSSPSEVIKAGNGNSLDINFLFVTMARSLGFDARLALASSWGDGSFKKDLQSLDYLRNLLVAVKVGDGWKFYDPARCRVKTGTLHWMNEGATALIATPRNIEWVTLPGTPAARSVQKRTASLELDEEGTMTGKVTIEYSGQSENVARQEFYKETASKISDLVRDRVRARMPSCEVSDVDVANANDVAKPMRLTYTVKIPNYAEKVGRRLFMQPAFFEKGAGSVFPSETRISDIFFKYPVANEDDVTIKIPDGYQLEAGNTPPSPGEANWGRYKVGIGINKRTNTIIYKREFLFKPRFLPVAQYKVCKGIFDYMHAQDAYILTLKAADEAGQGG